MITQFGISGISLLLDKSAFQSLSEAEMLLTKQYFRLNIPPILVLEVLGDLKKEFKNQTGQTRVQNFAGKLSSFGTSTNAHFKNLILSELLGDVEIGFYHPVVDTGELLRSTDGKHGILIQPSQERQLLDRWRDGDFSELDMQMSDIWRTLTTDPSRIQELIKYWKKISPDAKVLKTLDEVEFLVHHLLTVPSGLTDCLYMLLSEFEIPTNVAGSIFYRWETFNEKDLFKFAPYSMFCLRVRIFFNIALQLQLIGSRATNLLDLEYLFYLPFCRVFGSNDILHKTLAPYFITQDQYFHTGDELKLDLSKIIKIRSMASDAEKKRTWKEPPRNQDLLIYQIWKNILEDWPREKEWIPSPEEEQLMRDVISRFSNSGKIN